MTSTTVGRGGTNSLRLDWTWSDRFIPEIRKIVGPQLLTTASLEIDRHEAADQVLLYAKNLTIACRIRRPVTRAEYTKQFTLRSARSTGMKTEYEKIAEGFGDWLFYGFADHSPEPKLSTWYLVDLAAFRAHLILSKDLIRTGEQWNYDGTAFRWFDVSSFPATPRLLVAHSGPPANEVRQPDKEAEPMT